MTSAENWSKELEYKVKEYDLVEIKKILEENKIGVNDKARFGRTVLGLVCAGPMGSVERSDPEWAKKGLDIVKYLITEMNADPKASDNCVHDALKCSYWCSKAEAQLHPKEFSEIAFLLLENGADPSALDEGKDVLLTAVSEESPSVVKYLLNKNPELAKTSKVRGMSALRLAAVAGNEEIFEALLDAGADVNAVDNDGWSIIYTLALNGYTALFEKCVEKGATLDTLVCGDGSGRHALHQAAGAKALGMIEALITKYKVDPNVRDAKGTTALMFASRRGKRVLPDVPDLLLKLGADPNLVCQKGKNCYDYGDDAMEEEPVFEYWKGKGITSALENKKKEEEAAANKD